MAFRPENVEWVSNGGQGPWRTACQRAAELMGEDMDRLMEVGVPLSWCGDISTSEADERAHAAVRKLDIYGDV